MPTLGVSSRGPRRSRPSLPIRRHGRTLLITPRSRASETETDDEPQPEVLSAYALLFGTLGLGEFVLPTNSPISPLPYFGIPSERAESRAIADSQLSDSSVSRKYLPN